MKKRILCLLMLIAVLLCGFGPYEEGAQRVFDYADLLSDGEEAIVQGEIEALIQKIPMDMIVVTIDDAQGKSSMEYADDFYDEHGFGYGRDNASGILCLIDMDNREVYLSTAGDAIVQFTDDEIDEMLDRIVYWLGEGEYYQACMEFTYQVEDYGDNWDTALNGYYDESTGVFVEYTPEQIKALRRQAAIAQVLSIGSILSKMGIAMIVGAVVVLIMRVTVDHNSAPDGRTYLKVGSEKIRQQYDHKTNTTVTKRHIPRNENNGGSRSGGGGGGHSTVHRSSGGRSHGGGGRRF